MPLPTDQSRKRILHLDDDEVIAEFYREVLREKGFEVKWVGRVKDCLDELRRDQNWDAIVMDVTMPHAEVADLDYAQTDDGLLTGVFVGKKIRDGWPDIPVIVLTNRVPKIVAGHLNGVIASQDIKSKFDLPPFEFAEFLVNRLI